MNKLPYENQQAFCSAAYIASIAFCKQKHAWQAFSLQSNYLYLGLVRFWKRFAREIVGKKKRSIFRKSRKKFGFVGVQKQVSNSNDRHDETQRGTDGDIRGQIANTSQENYT